MNRTAAVRVVLLELAALTSAAEGVDSLTPVFIEGFESGSNCVWSQALPWTAQAIDPETTTLGTTIGGSNGIDATCQEGGAPEAVYLLSSTSNGTLSIVLDPESPIDADLGFYVRTSCAAIDEVLCVDEEFGGQTEFGQVAVTTGQPIFLFVDGFDSTDAGPFAVTLSMADAVCGDTTVNPPEVCDGTNLDGETCESLGYSGGSLSCATDCLSFDTSSCFNQTCGNSIIEGIEVCDGINLGGETCESLGYSGGTLSCATDCLSFDTSACFNQTCGNNVVEGTEVCDGIDLQGLDCTHFGFDWGWLQCLPTCDSFDFSLCFFF